MDRGESGKVRQNQKMIFFLKECSKQPKIAKDHSKAKTECKIKQRKKETEIFVDL